MMPHFTPRVAFNHMALSVGLLAQSGRFDSDERHRTLNNAIRFFQTMQDDDNNGLLWAEASLIAKHVPEAAELPFLFLDKMTRRGELNMDDMHDFARENFDMLAGKSITSLSGRFYTHHIQRVDGTILVPVAMRCANGGLAFMTGAFWDNARVLTRRARALDGFDAAGFIRAAENALKPQ